MKALFGLVALGVVILALSVSGPLSERLEDSNRYQRERQLLQLERERYEQARRAEWDSLTLPGNVLLTYGGFALLLAAGVLVWRYLDEGRGRKVREHQLVTVAGMPVPRAVLEHADEELLALMGEALRLDKARAIEEASRPIPPAHLSYTYAPRIAGSSAPALESVAAAAAAAVPSFQELLNRGDIGQDRPLVLGASSSGLITGSFRDLYSTLVAGQSGAGKSTTQRFFAAQASLHKARHIVIDPHLDAGDDSLAATLEPLSGLYVCEPADTERAILEAVKLARDIGEKRLHGQDKSREPILIWVDEATGLLAHSKIGPDLAELLEVIAQQLRKVAIYASVSAQIVTASRTGGDSALRDSMASVICHKSRRSQARLVLPLEDATLVERLEPGQAVLWRTSGASEVVGIPNTRAADVHEVARRLLSGSAPAMDRLHERAVGGSSGATVEPVWSQNGAGSSALGRGETLSAEARRVLSLFREGQDIAAIVRTLYGVTSASGSSYQRKSAEVQGLLRQALERN